MLIDWIHWLSSLNPDRLLAILGGLLLIDGPRYALTKIVMCLWDCLHDSWQWLRGTAEPAAFTYCPSVCVIIAGHNEADTIGETLTSIWGTYPRLEIIVIDDGSRDNMQAVARDFGHTHAGVKVLSRRERGGKASAFNWARTETGAEVVVCMDADTRLGPAALWEIVQPLKDPDVGVVSGAVLAHNPFTNLCTWLQAQEYLRTIFVGRMVAARLGILGIASGAFSAFRRSVLDNLGGWDVGPGEDGDMVLRFRKAGYDIAFAPYAQCFTNVPTRWSALFRQRRRWNRGAIRYRCRKHLDMAYFWSPSFRIDNFCYILNVWFFHVMLLYTFWVYVVWLIYTEVFSNPASDEFFWIVFTNYVVYQAFHLIQIMTVLFYSRDKGRDTAICAVAPFVPIYQLFQRVIRLVSLTEEILFRQSFQDKFYPERVREATWHW